MKRKLSTGLMLFTLILSFAFLANAQAYDVQKRYTLLEDKFYTSEMLTPFGHDFILEIGGLLNKDLKTVIDDGKKISKVEGSANKVTAAQDFLAKYDKTEQNVRIKVNIGIPLPSFTAWDVKVVPDFRINFGLGVLLGIRTDQFNIAQILEYVSSGIPTEIKTLILSKASSMSAGDDIVAVAVAGESPAIQAAAAPYLKKYYIPSNTTVPQLNAFAKADARVGIKFNYEYEEHFFGYLKVYGQGRADTKLRVTQDALINDGDIVDFGDEWNTTINLTADYQFGYKNGNLSGFASVEEIKLARMSDAEDKGAKLNYKEDPLFRLHGEYTYKFAGFTLQPFGGVHKRSSYGLSDGLYAGGNVAFHVLGDRLGIRVRGMVDQEHFTLAPLVKLWLFHAELMMKVPAKSEVDGVKPASLIGLNLRFFI